MAGSAGSRVPRRCHSSCHQTATKQPAIEASQQPPTQMKATGCTAKLKLMVPASPELPAGPTGLRLRRSPATHTTGYLARVIALSRGDGASRAPCSSNLHIFLQCTHPFLFAWGAVVHPYTRGCVRLIFRNLLTQKLRHELRQSIRLLPICVSFLYNFDEIQRDIIYI